MSRSGRRPPSLLAGGFASPPPNDLWAFDGAAWVQLDAALSDSSRCPVAMAREGIVYVCEGRDEVLSFEAFRRPEQLFDVALDATYVLDSAEITSVAIAAVSGGRPGAGSSVGDGADLAVWIDGRWSTMASNASAPDAPTPLEVAIDDEDQVPGARVGDRFVVRLTPAGETRLTGAEIATDYIEASFLLRLDDDTPAEDGEDGAD